MNSKRVIDGDAGELLYRLMLELDKHEAFDSHVIRESDAYLNASSALGWDIDWTEVYERQLGR